MCQTLLAIISNHEFHLYLLASIYIQIRSSISGDVNNCHEWTRSQGDYWPRVALLSWVRNGTSLSTHLSCCLETEIEAQHNTYFLSLLQWLALCAHGFCSLRKLRITSPLVVSIGIATVDVQAPGIAAWISWLLGFEDVDSFMWFLYISEISLIQHKFLPLKITGLQVSCLKADGKHDLPQTPSSVSLHPHLEGRGSSSQGADVKDIAFCHGICIYL